MLCFLSSFFQKIKFEVNTPCTTFDGSSGESTLGHVLHSCTHSSLCRGGFNAGGIYFNSKYINGHVCYLQAELLAGGKESADDSASEDEAAPKQVTARNFVNPLCSPCADLDQGNV